MLSVRVGPEFEETISRYSGQKSIIVNKLKDFLQLKSQYPFNGPSPEGIKFGDSDKRFRSGGKFTAKIDGIAHAHITHDLSIVYRVLRNSNVIELYGIYGHDTIGTGTPAKINRQDQMAARWSNMQFDPNKSLNLSEPIKQQKEKSKQVPAVKQQVAKSSDPAYSIAAGVDSEWPQRNFLEKYTQSPSKDSRLELIRQEVNYLLSIKQKNNRLFPNQERYFQKLASLVKIYKTAGRY